MLKLFSWNNGESSKLLAEALGIRRLKHVGSRFRPTLRDTLINWGLGKYDPNYGRVLNDPEKVRKVTNKLRFFLKYEQGIRDADGLNFNVPPYFFDRAAATQWLRESRGTLVCRTIVDGHEGAGIVLCDDPAQVPEASLYTAYVKKQAEYRVHVGRKPDATYVVIDQVQKVKKRGVEGDFRIRNTANGCIFIRGGINVPPCVVDGAVEAIKFYDLDFGAVDVIYNGHYDKAYVLEINTAPGIEGTSVQRYAEFFRSFQ